MALKRGLPWLVVLMATSTIAHAQPPPPQQPAPVMTPPRLIDAPPVSLPEGAEPLPPDAAVELVLTIGADGAVSEAQLHTPLRDDVDGRPVYFTLRVATLGGTELARRFGMATTPALPLTLRINPRNVRVNAVWLELDAEDPIGNASSLSRWLKLPR